MEETAATQQAPQGGPQRRRELSTISWPYNDLNDAVEIARVIESHVGTSTCDLPQLAAWAGHTTVESGAFRLRVTAARTYGLITTGTRQVALTDLGRAIVDPEREAQARVSAFLTVPLYRRLFERYEGQTLPSTSVALEADLVELGVAEKQKDRARQVFQRSADQAGFFAQGRNHLVRPAVREGAPEEHTRGGGGGRDDGGPKDLHPFILGLIGSLPTPGTVFPQREREKWIRGAQAAFDLMYEEEPNSSPTEPQPPSERSRADAQG